MCLDPCRRAGDAPYVVDTRYGPCLYQALFRQEWLEAPNRTPFERHELIIRGTHIAQAATHAILGVEKAFATYG